MPRPPRGCRHVKRRASNKLGSSGIQWDPVAGQRPKQAMISSNVPTHKFGRRKLAAVPDTLHCLNENSLTIARYRPTTTERRTGRQCACRNPFESDVRCRPGSLDYFKATRLAASDHMAAVGRRLPVVRKKEPRLVRGKSEFPVAVRSIGGGLTYLGQLVQPPTLPLSAPQHLPSLMICGSLGAAKARCAAGLTPLVAAWPCASTLEPPRPFPPLLAASAAEVRPSVRAIARAIVLLVNMCETSLVLPTRQDFYANNSSHWPEVPLARRPTRIGSRTQFD